MRMLKFLGISAALVPNLAFAHVSHSSADGFSGGLLHTLTGLDHLAALWCLGALAALFALAPQTTAVTQRTRPHWLWLPGLFVLGAIAGINLALQGLSINPEPVIGFSVLFWGVLLVMRSRLSFAVQAVASVLFAFFHGLAHGPVIDAVQAPGAFYAGLSLGIGLSFSAGFLATYYLTAANARKLAGLVSLTGLGYFFAASSFA